jgi:conjugative relaxase-like TrwC/TraI family protein
VISIGRIGSGAGAADYYLEKQAGCELDYYTGDGEEVGRWLGDGAAALGLTGRLDDAGEQMLRALLSGCGPDGQPLVRPVLRADPRGLLLAEPLVRAFD